MFIQKKVNGTSRSILKKRRGTSREPNKVGSDSAGNVNGVVPQFRRGSNV